MAKVSLTDITGGYQSVAVYNANNQLIEDEFDNCLSRDGTAPNSMAANIDMNSNKVTNLADGTNQQDAVTVAQLNAASVVVNTTAASAVTVADAGALLTADTVEGALAEIAAEVDANTAQVATNVTNIATNTADIATNTADIATNTANIATNTSDISTIETALGPDVQTVTGVSIQGFSTPPTTSIFFQKTGNLVTCIFQQTISGTSNSSTMDTVAGVIPAAYRPGSQVTFLFPITDNGVDAVGLCRVSSDGKLEWFPDPYGSSTFTASGTKRYRGQMCLCWPIQYN